MNLPSLRTGALLVESLIFTVLIPGSVTVLLPTLILPAGTAVVWPSTPAQCTGLVLALAGGGVYFWCLWHFVVTGRGIPAPVDHPRRLVVRGLYRYVRNPMYLGVLGILLGEIVYFQAASLIAYTVLWWLLVHVFVVFHEEPTLHAKFGAQYDRYARAVRRWVPGAAFDDDASSR